GALEDEQSVHVAAFIAPGLRDEGVLRDPLEGDLDLVVILALDDVARARSIGAVIGLVLPAVVPVGEEALRARAVRQRKCRLAGGDQRLLADEASAETERQREEEQDAPHPYAPTSWARRTRK